MAHTSAAGMGGLALQHPAHTSRHWITHKAHSCIGPVAGSKGGELESHSRVIMKDQRATCEVKKVVTSCRQWHMLSPIQDACSGGGDMSISWGDIDSCWGLHLQGCLPADSSSSAGQHPVYCNSLCFGQAALNTAAEGWPSKRGWEAWHRVLPQVQYYPLYTLVAGCRQVREGYMQLREACRQLPWG